MDVTSIGTGDNNHQENPFQIERSETLGNRQEILHAKWDIKFLIVANTVGLQRFVKQETLQAGFVHASTLLQHPQPRIRQLRNAVTAASSLQGLYPPARFAKASKDTNVLWTSVELPAEASLQQALHTNIVKETELLHSPQDIIYTDGSKIEIHTFGTVTGSGVYRQAPAAALQFKVHPIGQGMLNTINRAELVAILVALRECRPYEDECIATDSRCLMQKINKHLRAPAQTKDDCHQPLLHAITTLIVERAKTGLTTKIVKVKSHIGVHGNEMADKLANEAAEECTKARQFDRDVSQEYCEPFKDRFWILHEIQVPTTTGTSKKPRNWSPLGICTATCLTKYMQSTNWALQTKTQPTSDCGKTSNLTGTKTIVTSSAL